MLYEETLSSANNLQSAAKTYKRKEMINISKVQRLSKDILK